MSQSPEVVIVQDHLVQRGGAERALLSMLRALPGARVLTAFYLPDATYSEYAQSPPSTLAINRLGLLRRRHRLAFPLLAPSFSVARVDADVTICATSGWAQGVRSSGRKIIYVHSLARWLHDPRSYAADLAPGARAAAWMLKRPLGAWDLRTMRSGHRLLTNSRAERERIRVAYGLDAEVIPPPVRLSRGTRAPTVEEGLDDGFFLAPTRLVPYKNVDVLIEAFRQATDLTLVIAGSGPLRTRLESVAPSNVRFLGDVEDDRLCWLYEHCTAVISAAFEPFGLTPIEAATFGRPTVALDSQGFRETVIDGVTGVRFTELAPESVIDAITRLRSLDLDESVIRDHAAPFDEATFAERLRAIVAEEASRA